MASKSPEKIRHCPLNGYNYHNDAMLVLNVKSNDTLDNVIELCLPEVNMTGNTRPPPNIEDLHPENAKAYLAEKNRIRNPRRTVDEVWKEAELKQHDCVHFILDYWRTPQYVSATSSTCRVTLTRAPALIKRERSSSLTEKKNRARAPRRNIDEEYDYIRKRCRAADFPPSSGISGPILMAQQRQNPIYTGRSASLRGYILGMLVPAFARFKREYVPGTTRDATPSESTQIYDFFVAACDFYHKKSMRRDMLELMWDELLDIECHNSSSTSRTSQDTNTSRTSQDTNTSRTSQDTNTSRTSQDRSCLTYVPGIRGDAEILFKDTKSELAFGGAEPVQQVARGAVKAWQQSKRDLLSRTCCCPAPLINIVGPYLKVSGIAFNPTPMNESFTSLISLELNRHPLERHILEFNNLLHHLRTCIEDLRVFYSALKAPDPLAFMPRHRSFPIGDSKVVASIEYTDILLSGEPTKTLYKARVLDQDCVVKICHYFIVVMHLVKGRMLPERNQLTDDIEAQLKRALNLLKTQKLVHGDLRRPNILLSEDQRVQIIDFEWAGEEGQRFYPLDINRTLNLWHTDVVPGAQITHDHDVYSMWKLGVEE
ncbi:hypothetical protein DACRYDRAFT_107059 [Dacryopinax primogenitus]|uniref:non-specific serine/threonine protein kinase n=1 Tax=Dacryopinax primogenitus (strain DJM 731) TaxID=1858805 RepID=M5G034_DACPD|nr:uncharacterized protein DACRYDRAFT_107059 [Dacryopinax primogenitus]EJU02114.1 hypothetical protein DACRYDRAFT_107059 [Dacryopinax primogenitus]